MHLFIKITSILFIKFVNCKYLVNKCPLEAKNKYVICGFQYTFNFSSLNEIGGT